MTNSEHKKYSVGQKFLNAWAGIQQAIASEKNLRFHLIAGMGVGFGAWYFAVTLMEAAILALTIGMVIGAELLNTAIEELCDFATLDTSAHIKKIKDISAGAVLVLSLMSVVVGVCIFGPYIAGLWS